MSNPLFEQLASVRQRIVRTVWAFGLGRTVCVLIGLALAFGLMDWLLHVDDTGIRVVFSLSIVVATVVVAWKSLFRPLTAKLSDIDIARQVERCNGGLDDRLSSSVQFLQQSSDESVGSMELQQQVVEQTVHNLQRLDISSAVDPKPARRSLLLGGLTAVVAAAAISLSPVNAITAVKRLTMPFGNHPWPKQTVLRFVDEQGRPVELDARKPWRRAEGESLDLLIENTAGELPEDARIQFRLADNKKLFARATRPTTVQDKNGQRRDVGVASVTLAKSLIFRAIGGDDDGTGWQSVEVIPVPILEDLKLSIQPPAYANQPVVHETNTSQLTVLAGSRISVTAKSSKRLKAASLIVGDTSPVSLSVDRTKRLATTFTADTPGTVSWHIEMSDSDGFTSGKPRRYELRVQADQVPDVYIDQPAQDLQVTPNASVPVSVVAKDDLGVKDVRLQFRTGLSEDAQLQTIVLKQNDQRPEHATVDYEWKLTELQLADGDRIVFHAEATDDFDLGKPHVGRSVPRTLIVVSPAEKQSELAARQAELMLELERVAELQTRTHDQTRELQVQMEQAGTLQDDDIDLLKRVEIEQRRIASRLFEAGEGLASQTQQLLNEVDANRLQESENHQQLERLGADLKRVQEDMMPAVENQITKARKSVQADADDPANTPAANSPAAQQAQQALADATEKQQQIVNSLQQSLSELANWKQRFDIVGDLNQVISQQEQLNNETAETARETLTRRLNELTPQQRADLARLAERQRQQAREMRDVTEALNQAAEQLAGSVKESVEQAADELSRRPPESQMETAADRISSNQLGGATGQQAQILEQLNQVRDTLNNQSIDDTESMVKKLKQREAELNELRDRQEKMVQRLQNLDASNADKQQLEQLVRDQQQLREHTETAAEQLRRSQARQAARSSNRAAEQMRGAEQSLDPQSGQPGQSKIESAEQFAKEALEDLEQALDETAEQRERAESELAQEMMFRLADALVGLVEQQKSVIDETKRLEDLRQQAGRLTRSQSKSVLNLATVQQQILDESATLAETVQDARVVAFTLSSAVRRMQRAVDLLSKRDTGTATLSAETFALQRLQNLLTVLRDEQKQPQSESNDTQPPSPQQGDPQSGPQQDTVSLMAQLTLLKSLQQDLHNRTVLLETERDQTGQLTEAQQADVKSIAEEQGTLADLAAALAAEVASADAAPDADADAIDPEFLPELELQP